MPASRIAASTASVARDSSERPEALENSVAPIPQTATFPAYACVGHSRPHRERDDDRPRHVVAQAVGAADADRHPAPVTLGLRTTFVGHRAREGHRVVGVVGGTETDRNLAQEPAGSRPVRDEAPDEPVGREDVHEDVLRAALAGQLGVVVNVLVVPARERAGDDKGPGDRHRQLGEGVADGHVVVAQGRPRRHAATSLRARSASRRPSRTS